LITPPKVSIGYVQVVVKDEEIWNPIFRLASNSKPSEGMTSSKFKFFNYCKVVFLLAQYARHHTNQLYSYISRKERIAQLIGSNFEILGSFEVLKD
jgi:hypothetical protein